MVKNGKIRSFPDRSKINLASLEELVYWADRFDVSPARLRAIVARVGPSVKDVYRYFGRL